MVVESAGPAPRTDTSPWLPSNASWDEIDYTKGITMKDKNNNEWTWVVVPKSVTASAATIGDGVDPTNTPLETALKDYAATVVTDRGNYTDTWYSDAQTGLTQTQYNDKKRAMLNGIKEHGGFWIGKYEVGFTETPTSSNYKQTTRTAVIKQDAYPYNYITCANANTKAMDLATQAGGNGSLLFGTQWDLTLKYLVTQGAITQAQITNSTDWGNYSNSTFTINSSSAKYRSSDTSWPSISGTKAANSSKLLTTGAAENTTKKLNIVDLAGNIFEWTMEYTSRTYLPCTGRAASYGSNGDSNPASFRSTSNTSYSGNGGGFRSSLY